MVYRNCYFGFFCLDIRCIDNKRRFAGTEKEEILNGCIVNVSSERVKNKSGIFAHTGVSTMQSNCYHRGKHNVYKVLTPG